jgi:hypothetical protein
MDSAARGQETRGPQTATAGESPAVTRTTLALWISASDQNMYFRVSWAAHCDSPRCWRVTKSSTSPLTP